MSGRGRGRGGRGGLSGFNREQLDYMGAGPNSGEQLPRPVTQPPPLYPLLDSKPIPLDRANKDYAYKLILKQDFVDNMQYKSTYVNSTPTVIKEPELEIDKLIAQLPKMQNSCNLNWILYPKELRSKVTEKRSRIQSKEIDIDTRLNKLQKMEEIGSNRPIKTETIDPEEEELGEEEQDEEMDEGTDYVNNYFDNGEEYEDDLENEDDGPIY